MKVLTQITWWSTYLGCDHAMFTLIMEPKSLNFFFKYYSLWKKMKFPLFVMILWVLDTTFII